MSALSNPALVAAYGGIVVGIAGSVALIVVELLKRRRERAKPPKPNLAIRPVACAAALAVVAGVGAVVLLKWGRQRPKE